MYPGKVDRLQEIEPELAGGTTAVIAVIVDGQLYVANVGDSRAVVVYKSGDIKQVKLVYYNILNSCNYSDIS